MCGSIEGSGSMEGQKTVKSNLKFPGKFVQ